jgi:ketosteroid isomerase-like protein
VSVGGLFNEAINAGNVAALAELMTDTHRFINSAGTTVEGKAARIEAWRGFSARSPTTATSSTSSRTLAVVLSSCEAAPNAASPRCRDRPDGVPSSAAGLSTSGKSSNPPRLRADPAPTVGASSSGRGVDAGRFTRVMR